MWVSVDPRCAEVVAYPEEQAKKLEDAYRNMTGDDDVEVYLGPLFHTATVHLQASKKADATFFQTTPGNMDWPPFHRYPGYRSVMRLSGPFPVMVQLKRLHGEWRVADIDSAERTVVVN